jgi:hypothetical protein
LFWRFPTLFLDDLMQSDIDIFCHARGVATDKEVRTFFQPGKELLCMLQHPVLDIDFVGLIARKRSIESGQ